jgi:phage gpG-like protein
MPVYGHIDFDSAPLIKIVVKTDHKAQNLKPVFREVREELRFIYTSHFLSNGNGTWKPLDPEYGAWKSRHFPGAPTLIRSGELFQSIDRFTVDEMNDMSARFGTDLEVAKFHQYGTWKMAKREIIFEPPLFARRLAEKIADHIEKAD